MLDLKTEQLLNFDAKRAAIEAMRLMGIDNPTDLTEQSTLKSLTRELEQDNASKLYRRLRDADDTVHNIPLNEYLRIVGELGFEEVYSKPFSPYAKLDSRQWDKHIILAHRDGYILNVSTKGNWLKGPTSINDATLWHNFSVTADFMNFQHRGTAKNIRHTDGSAQYRAGRLDAKIAFRHEWAKLKNTTRPHEPWRMRPEGFDLTNSFERRGADGSYRRGKSTKDLTREHISEMPEWVQEMIDAPQWTETNSPPMTMYNTW